MSFTQFALENNLCRPIFADNSILLIKDGRNILGLLIINSRIIEY